MSLFPKYIKEFEKQAFQCKHCKTVFMAGPNEWHYIKPEERRMQDEKEIEEQKMFNKINKINEDF